MVLSSFFIEFKGIFNILKFTIPFDIISVNGSKCIANHWTGFYMIVTSVMKVKSNGVMLETCLNLMIIIKTIK